MAVEKKRARGFSSVGSGKTGGCFAFRANGSGHRAVPGISCPLFSGPIVSRDRAVKSALLPDRRVRISTAPKKKRCYFQENNGNIGWRGSPSLSDESLYERPNFLSSLFL